MIDEFTLEPRIAYFSMEIALRNEIPTYAGGLGVLAGDTVRSAADLGLPFVAISLASRAGYFRQELDLQGRQIEHPSPWEPAQWAQPLEAKVVVSIGGRVVWVGGWLYLLEGQSGAHQPVVLLDTDYPENAPADRAITAELYGGDEERRLEQEIVLGIGGARLLQALGFEIRQYHMNEGHSALLGIELLRRYRFPPEDLRPDDSPYDLPRVRELCCFTTHTPVEAGHDRFSYALVERVLGFDPGLAIVDRATLARMGGAEALNMTHLALHLSEYVNGVAKRHAEVAGRMFPEFHVHAVTNGVHSTTWAAPPLRALYDRFLPAWRHEPELLNRVECCVPGAALLAAHAEAKAALIERVHRTTGIALDPAVAVLGFARRMTSYKRPDLLFEDLDRLRRIARATPFQLVLAGKAHPRDAQGKRLIEALHAWARELRDVIAIAYLPDYDLDTAAALVAGADLWLNTPLPPLEASGTSGMKAALNGVPQLSVLDGWWVEGCVEGVTGWAVGELDERAGGDAAKLYDKLEQVVLPLYYAGGTERPGWLRVMQGAISKNAAYFNSHRMMRRYATEAYRR
jgi:glycogen phosphorylase